MKKIIFILLLGSMPVYAKPVNLSKITKNPGFSSEIETSYQRETGDQDKTNLKFDIFGQYAAEEYLLLGFNRLDLEKNNGENKTYKLQQIRYRSLKEKWYIESFYQREIDPHRELTLKSQYGVGPYKKIFDGFFSLELGYSFVIEEQKFKKYPKQYANQVHSYLNSQLKILPLLELIYIMYTENKLNDTNHFKLFTKTSLQLTPEDKKYIIRLNLDTEHISHPFAGEPRVSTSTFISLGVKF